jgi:hypothetical protein
VLAVVVERGKPGVLELDCQRKVGDESQKR